ncbi:Helix-turn-helix [Kordiimonas lacus]|uniref:Helix-turn-helix n=2 Tax=Kordiimonas lacus TaxID=637679 RepID=A0A1G7A3H4_9PROT|nr:Helix-turn-helix [Kordiimonas lacus]
MALQAKLTVGAKNDPLEAEADRTAEKVVSVPERGKWRQAEWEDQPRMAPEEAQKADEAQKAPEEPQKAPEEAKSAPDEAQKAAEEAQGKADEAQAARIAHRAAEEAQAAPEETKAAPEETQKAPEEAQTAPEEVQSEPEEAQAAPEEAQSAPEEAQAMEEPKAKADETVAAKGEEGGEGELAVEDFAAAGHVFDDGKKAKKSPDENAAGAAEKEGDAADNDDKAVAATPDFEAAVEAAKSGGVPLPPKAKAFMEDRFGADFSKVRIHLGADADRLCKQIGAKAFAIGYHIFFSSGRFNPDSREGRFLLAHELTHVVQQKGGIRTQEERAAAAEEEAKSKSEETQAAPEEPQAAAEDVQAAPEKTQAAPEETQAAAEVQSAPREAQTAPEEAKTAGDEVQSAPEEAQATTDEVQSAPQEAQAAPAEAQAAPAEIQGASEEAQAAPEEAQAAPEEAQAAPNEAQALPAVQTAPVAAGVSRANRQVQGGWLADKINKYARQVPGYTLITVLVGYNPILGESVERTPMNLVGGILGMVPGGTVLFDKLKESGALQEAFDWLAAEVKTLNLSWQGIKNLLSEAWDKMSLVRGFSYNLNIIKQVFGPTVRRIINFGKAIGTKIAELIFKGALKLVGAPVEKFMALFNKGKAVLGKIFSDPIQFVKNLAGAVKQGLQLFLKNIRKHLMGGLIGWLTGALGGAGITLPAKWDIKGIFSLVMQILGLTYDRIREKLVKRLGEKTVGRIEKAIEFIKLLVTKGPVALWEKLKDKLASLKDAVISGIKEWVISKVIMEGVTWVLGLLNPAGALIKVIKVLYSVVMFFIERWSQIVAFATSVFNSIGEIANGQLAKAAKYVEATIGKAVPVMISFLASLLGLGGISDKIRKIIEKIRKPIDKGVDKILDWIVKKAKDLIAKVKGKGKGKEDNKTPKSIGGKGIEAVLAQPPTKEPRSPAMKKTELDQATQITKKIEAQTNSTSEVAEYFPKLKKRFGLKQIGYEKLGQKGAGIKIAINPEAVIRDDDGKLQGNVADLGNGASKLGGGTTVKFTPQTKFGMSIGHKMEADILGPDHPKGSRTGAGDIDPVMRKLNPPSASDDKNIFVKGHLLHSGLGGPGKDGRNLFPLTYSVNSLHESNIESELTERINKHRYWMSYKVTTDVLSGSSEKPPYELKGKITAEAQHLSPELAPVGPVLKFTSEFGPGGGKASPSKVPQPGETGIKNVPEGAERDKTGKSKIEKPDPVTRTGRTGEYLDRVGIPGSVITQIRNAAGMSQGAFGAAIGVRQAAVSKWELGKRGPTTTNELRIVANIIIKKDGDRYIIDPRFSSILAGQSNLLALANSHLGSLNSSLATP